MQTVTVEELINYKILPFNIYTKGDKLLFPEGEVLTPGKFLKLRHVDVIYKKEGEKSNVKSDETLEKKAEDKLQNDDDKLTINHVQVVPVKNFKTAINRKSNIPPDEQIKLKNFYDNTFADISKTNTDMILSKMKDIRNKIQYDYLEVFDKVTYSSQIRLLGDYESCHAINVAMLAAALSRKLGKTEEFISDIVLAALLHDIGKICIPKNLVNKQNQTAEEQKLYHAHTKIGYNIIKNKMKLSDRIAKVALEHHERNDGTGYPMGKSGEFISEESQIISVCNFFDNLTFNKTTHKVYNAKEALKIMLEMGSKSFAIDTLYGFIYMYSYDDTMTFDEMTLS